MGSDKLKRLMREIEYVFQDQSLIEQALHHRSLAGKNNERLEFLGDAILNCVIAHALYQKYPNSNEGELSRLRAYLVKQETLANVAKAFKLSDVIQMSSGELKSGGAYRDSILSDALEAIIGAIYLDSDFQTVQAKVQNWFQSRLDKAMQFQNKDPKTTLQEFTQAKKLELPKYTILKVEGEEHEKIFTIECELSAFSKKFSGCASSRRKAEQRAAELMLEWLDAQNA